MPASIGYSDDKKKEYAGRFIGGALSFLIKKFGVPEELANSVGDEFGGFVAGVELSGDDADTAEKHWNQALDRTWTRMRKQIDLPDEFWEPLEEVLFITPDTVVMFLKHYGKDQNSDDDHERDDLDIYTEVDRIINDIHKDSDHIDTDSIPERFSKDLVTILKQEIRNDISLSAIIQNLILEKKITDIKTLPYNESTKIPLTMIPASIELIGREDDTIAIRDVLTKNNVVSLRADGGVGKTAVAAKIINDVKGEIELEESPFKHVAWITSTGDIKSDLTKLEAQVVYTAVSADEKFKAACLFLEDNPTFLVIDNMDKLPSIQDINTLNTISGRTKILITTRVKIRNIREYSLKQMERQDSIVLFYKHYLDIPQIPKWQEIEKRADKSDVENIVDKSICNALMIELVAKMACWEYSGRLDELWNALETDVFGTDSDNEIETDHNSYLLSEDDLKLQGQIRSLYQMSELPTILQELMRFFTIFPAEAVIFTGAFKLAGFEVKDLKYLSDRGWIEKAGDGFLIHTMVKGSVDLQEGDLDIEKIQNLIEELCYTEKYIPGEMVYTQKAEHIVVPESVCRILVKKGCEDARTADLLYSVALVYYGLGDYSKALKYLERTLEIREKVLDEEHLDIASTYDGLALVYHALGDYSSALEYNQMALKIVQDTMEPGHPVFTLFLNTTATIYFAQGDYKKAIEYYEKALEIDKKEWGEEHPFTATAYNNLALAYKSQGNYTRALEYYEDALNISKKELGVSHPDIAITYSNIAGVFEVQGDYLKSIEYYMMALDISEKVLGPEHPNVAATYNGIANAYKSQGNYSKALEFFEKALDIIEKVLGLEHPYIATTYCSMANIYQDQRDNTKALDHYKKALVIKQKVLGPQHLDIATLYKDLAHVSIDQEEYSNALEYYGNAIMIEEKTLGPEHPITAESYNDISFVYFTQGNYDKAQQYLEKSLKIREKVLGVEHPNIAETYFGLGLVYYAQSDYDKALEYLEKSLEIRVKVVDKEQLDIAETYNVLGLVYNAMGDFDKALDCYDKALMIIKNAFGQEHPLTATTYNNIAGVYGDKGDVDKAQEYFEKSLVIREAVLGAEHTDTAESYNNLGILYYELEKYGKAQEYLQDSYNIYKKILGDEHPQTKNTLHALELALERMEES